LNMDGTAGPAARAAEAFADRLRDASGLSVDLFDERLTSVEAEERLRELSGSHARDSGSRARAKRTRDKGMQDKGKIDALAASIILAAWLSHRRSGK
jgi:putative Holliday junction resolvase